MSRAKKEHAAKTKNGYILTDRVGGCGVVCKVLSDDHVKIRRPYNNLSMRKKYARKPQLHKIELNIIRR